MNLCTLSPPGLDAQRGRAAALLASVERLDRSAEGFSVQFGASVDRDLVGELVATEKECCSFLDIDWDSEAGVLSVGSPDREAVAALAGFFEQGSVG